MINYLLLKFVLIFIGGATVAVVVTQVILPNLVKQQHPPLLPKEHSTQTDILGTDSQEVSSIDKSDLVKTFVQDTVNQVVGHFAQSQAVAPLVQTSQSVQKAIEDVKILPVNQRAAICREICALPQ